MDAALDGAYLGRQTAYWRARTLRLNRAADGIRSSPALAMILSSSAVPLRPLAEMTPSSAICPRIDINHQRDPIPLARGRSRYTQCEPSGLRAVEIFDCHGFNLPGLSSNGQGSPAAMCLSDH